MNWFTRVRNSLGFAPEKKSTEKDLWIKCPSCQEMLFVADYEANLSVCPKCEHHGRIGADARLALLLDPGFEVLPLPKVTEDPLQFKDTKKYTDRLKAARAANPHEDAFVVGSGFIETRPAVVGVQDFSFMGGSMGMAVGQAFCEGAQKALDRGCAYVVVTAAGGARMQEGILSLMQMPRATVMTRRLKQAGRIGLTPIYMDSPMAINATDLLCAHLEDHRMPADVCDAAWLQQLHAAGLLRGSAQGQLVLVFLRRFNFLVNFLGSLVQKEQATKEQHKVSAGD